MNRRILGLALPNIVTNITVPLLGMVDMAIVGHLSGDHIGAIAIGTQIFNLIYWNFGFLRMGTSGLTAQAFGAERKARQNGKPLRAALGRYGLQMHKRQFAREVQQRVRRIGAKGGMEPQRLHLRRRDKQRRPACAERGRDDGAVCFAEAVHRDGAAPGGKRGIQLFPARILADGRQQLLHAL